MEFVFSDQVLLSGTAQLINSAKSPALGIVNTRVDDAHNLWWAALLTWRRLA